MPGSLLLLDVLGHPGERLKLLLQRVLALKPFVLLVWTFILLVDLGRLLKTELKVSLQVGFLVADWNAVRQHALSQRTLRVTIRPLLLLLDRLGGLLLLLWLELRVFLLHIWRPRLLFLLLVVQGDELFGFGGLAEDTAAVQPGERLKL
jgi:hypothetical protein